MIPRRARLWDATNVTVLVVAAIAALWRPPGAFLERAYAVDVYARVQRTVTSLTNRTQFAVGDIFVVAVVAAVVAVWISQLRRSRGWPACLRALLRTCALAAFLYLWFMAAWGWNYSRASLAVRLGYAPATPQQQNLRSLENGLAGALNAAALAAHAERARGRSDGRALEDARVRTLRAIDFNPHAIATRPKRWLFDAYFNAAGISGMFFPFTYETYLASDVLWFEYPFDIEHEWSHAAGVARESDANFVAALATLDSPDPIVRYSGLLEVYAGLPRGPSDRRLSRLVLGDYRAMRKRNEQRVVPAFSRLAWGTYDSYLKSQHVRSGVANYSEYVRLLLGTAVGRDALARAARPGF